MSVSLGAPARVARVTAGLEGLGGRIRSVPDDFYVEEIPLAEPEGEGEHVVFEVEKRGLSTFEALLWISKGLQVSEHSIGYAGLKDAHARTRQSMSVHRVDPERVLAFRHPKIRVLSAARHPSRIRIGHLKGNRFTIRIRGADAKAVPAARKALGVLATRGVPNAYGVQRFGVRQDGHILGRAVVRGEFDAFLSLLAGRPNPREHDPRLLAARGAFDAGDVARALALFPPKHRVVKKALSTLLRTGSAESAFHSLGRRPRRIYVSAYQSYLYNLCLDARVVDGTFDRLLAGDLAWLHESGALYSVEDEAVEAERALDFTASPTGPLVGYDPRPVGGRERTLEDEVLSGEGLSDDLYRAPLVRTRATRRPYRVPLVDASLEVEDDRTVLARFTLPPGSFATVVLDELMKPGPLGEDPALPIDEGGGTDDSPPDVADSE